MVPKDAMALSKEMLCGAHLPAGVAPEIKQLADLMQNLALGREGVGSKAGNEEVAEGMEGGSMSQTGDDAQY